MSAPGVDDALPAPDSPALPVSSTLRNDRETAEPPHISLLPATPKADDGPLGTSYGGLLFVLPILSRLGLPAWIQAHLHDPAVAEGVMRAELFPYRIALLNAGNA